MASENSAPASSLRAATQRWQAAPTSLRFVQRHALHALADELDRLHDRVEGLVNNLADGNSRVSSLLRSGRPFEHQSVIARDRARSGESDLAQSLVRVGLESELTDDGDLTDELWKAVHLIRSRLSARAGEPDRNVDRDLALLREASMEFADARDNLTAAVATFGGGRSTGRPKRRIRMRA